MQKLNVDLNRLAEAMNDADLNRMYYLHFDTGLLSGTSGPSESANDTEFFGRVDNKPNGYQPVGRTRPESTHSDMDDFVRILADRTVPASLLAAIRSRRAVEQFTVVFADTPTAENLWTDLRTR